MIKLGNLRDTFTLLDLPVLSHQFNMGVTRRREYVDTFKAGQGVTAMGNVGRMDADVAGFHVNDFSINRMFFGSVQNDQNLFAFMRMNRKFSTGFLLDEADQDVFAEYKFGFCFVSQGNVGNVL